MDLDIKKHLKIVAVIFYIIAGGFLLSKLMPVLMPFVIALAFAVLLNPVVDIVEKRLRFPRNLASITVIVFAAGALVAIAVIIGSEIYTIGEDLVTGFMSGKNFDGLKFISQKIYEIFGARIDLVESFKNLINPALTAAVNIIRPIAAGAPQVFVSVIVFILATHFLIADKLKIEEFFNKLTKGKFNILTDGFKNVSKKSVIKYIKAQFTIMLITFGELFVGFTIIGWLGIVKLPYMFVIILGIAILDALPIFGTGAVLIPWAVYGIVSGNFPMAMAMIILYLVCLTVRQLIEPKIVGESLGMHPLITLLAMYIGLKAIGLAGMILFPILTVLVIQLFKMGVFDGFIKGNTH